jgi:large repetitive protein
MSKSSLKALIYKNVKNIFKISITITLIHAMWLGSNSIMASALDSVISSIGTRVQSQKDETNTLSENETEKEVTTNVNEESFSLNKVQEKTTLDTELKLTVPDISDTFGEVKIALPVGTEVATQTKEVKTTTPTDAIEIINLDKSSIKADQAPKIVSGALNFEFGNPEEHLMFSKPVKIETAVESNLKSVEVNVLHKGDLKPSASGLSLNPDNCEINSDATLLVPVKDGKIIFYTCGASSFTITPSAGTATITSPANGANVKSNAAISGTGSNNNASVTLKLLPAGTNIGTANISNSGDWTVNPTTVFPLGSNTICIAPAGTNCVTFNVIPNSADIEVTKTVDKATAVLGQTLNFTIDVKNLGPDTALSTTSLKDILSTSLTNQTVNSCVASGGATCPVLPTIAQLAAGYALPNIPVNGNLQFKVSGKAGALGTIPNTASVTVTGNTVDQVNTNNSPLTPTSTVISANTAPVAVADTYTTPALASVTLTPLDLDTDPNPRTTLTISSINGTALTPGTAQVIAIAGKGTVNINPAGVITFNPLNTFAGSAVFPYVLFDGNLTATANITVNVTPKTSDVQVTKTVDKATGFTGFDLNYTVNFKNLGPDVADIVTIKDAMPASLINQTIVSCTASSGATCPLPMPTVAQLAAGFAINSLPANGNLQFKLKAKANAAGAIPNTATAVVSGISTDPATATNNSATASTLITANVAPTAVNDSYSTPAVTDVILNPLNGDSDPNAGTTLTIVSINGVALTPGLNQNITIAGKGIVNISASGVIQFTPGSGVFGVVTFPYVITDGNLTATANEVITVTLPALTCNMGYATEYTTVLGADTRLMQYDPSTNISTIMPFALPGQTRASAMTPDGKLIVYYDDLTGKFRSYRVEDAVTNISTTAIGNSAINRLAFNQDGKLFALAGLSLIEIDPLTLQIIGTPANITDKPGNTVSVNALAGGDIIFDVSEKMYVIDNGGRFFRIDTTTKVATYLGTQSASSPAGIAFAPDGNIWTFSSANGNVYKIDLANNSTTNLNVPNIPFVQADAFSCAFPFVAPIPGADKQVFRVTGAAVNGTGGTVSPAQATQLSPGDVLEYKVVLRNSGKTSVANAKYQDTLASTVTYIAGSTKMNGLAVTDAAGPTFPYTVASPVQSPALGAVAGPPAIPAIAAVAGLVRSDNTPLVNTDDEVILTYRVRLPDPFTSSPRSITNQGKFSGDEMTTTNTNDPSTTAPGDPTTNPIQYRPIAVNDNYSTATNTAVVIAPLTGDSDPDTGQTISIQSINGITLTPGTAQTIPVTNGSVSVSTTGVITFTPANGYTGTVIFPYVIVDSVGGTATANESIIVSANPPPIAQNDLYTTTTTTPVTLTPLAGDSGTNLTIKSINGTTLTPGTAQTINVPNGVVIVTTAGVISFVANSNFSGQATFPYVIQNAIGTTATANETITINPKAVDDTYTAPSGLATTLNPLNGDTSGTIIKSINGVDLTPGTAQTINVPNGVVTVSATGVITFTPDIGYTGPITFPYVIKNATGQTATANQNITVTPPPTATNDSYGTIGVAPVTLTPLTGDTAGTTIKSINGTTLTPGTAQTIVVPNGLVTVSNTGVITFTANPGYTGMAQFPYVIQDSNGVTATANESIIVNLPAVNVCTNKIVNGDFATNLNGWTASPEWIWNNGTAALAIDSLTNKTISQSISGFVINNGQVLFKIELQPAEANNLTTFDATLEVNFGGVNYLTIANPNSTGIVAYTPANGATYSTNTNVRNNLATIYLSIPVASTSAKTLEFNHVSGDDDWYIYNIATDFCNAPPVAVNDSYTAVAGTPKVLTPLTGDTDTDSGQTLTVTKIGTTTLTPGTAQTIVFSEGIVTVSATGVITFDADPSFVGVATIPYTISDGNGGVSTANEIITVIKAVDDAKTTAVGTAITYNPLTNDTLPTGSAITAINGIPVTVLSFGTPISVPNGTVVVNSNGTITFTPSAGYTGTSSFTYEITTPDGTKATAIDTITVVKAVDDISTTLINTPTTYNPLTNDIVPSGSTISLINGVTPVVGTPIPVTGGTVTQNSDGTVTVTPTPGSVVPVTFPYQVTTPDGATVTANDTINIENPKIEVDKKGTYNDTNGNASGDVGETITFTFTVKNTGNVTLTNITLADAALTAAGESVVGGPIASLAPNGIDSTTFTATHTVVIADISAGYFTNSATASGTPPNGPAVSAVSNDPNTIAANDPTRTLIPPFAYPDVKSTPVNTAVTYNPLANDIVPSGSSVGTINGVIPVVGTPIPVPNGTATLNSNGTITFNPATGFVGQSSFPYTVNTVAGPYASTNTINVYKANDDIKTTITGQPTSYNPLTNDNIPSGSTITKINGVTPVVGTPIPVTGGTVTLNSDGTITVTPTPGSLTPITFPYEVTTPDGTKVTANDTINQVNAVDDTKTTNLNSPISYNPLTNDNVPVGSTISLINGVIPVVGTPIPVTGGTVTLNSDGTITVTPASGNTLLITFPYEVTTPDGTKTSATDTININAPKLEVIKSSTYQVANPPLPSPVGDTIAYVFTVKNTGNVTLSNVSITDSKCAPVSGGTLATLVVGATDSTTFTCIYTVTAADLTAGKVVNSATSSAKDPLNSTITDVSDSTDPSKPGDNDPTVNLIPITAVNDTKTTPVGTPVAYNPLTNDTVPVGSTITKINGVTPVVGTPIPVTGGIVTLNANGTVTVTPTPGSLIPVTFPYEVTTPDGLIAIAADTVTPIQAIDDIKTAVVGSSTTYNPLTNDTVPVGSTITKINGVTPVVGTPIPVTGGIVTLNANGTVTVTPTPGSLTPVTFPYEVTTPDGTKVTANDTINQVNAVDDIKTTVTGTPITYNPASNDTNIPAGSTITKIGTTPVIIGTPITVAGGTVTVNNDGTITVTPTPGSLIPVTFPYEITTPDGTKVTANDTINQVNAVDDTKTTQAGIPISYNPITNDNVPVGSTITKINGVTPVVGTPIAVTGGTVTLNANGTVTVTPTPGSVTTISFGYEVTTPDGTKTVATNTVTVTNLPPVAVDNTYTTTVGVPVTISPLVGDSDPDGNPITILSINGTALTPGVAQTINVTNGVVTINPAGVITVTPATGFVGDVTFPYVITDGNTATATANQIITIPQIASLELDKASQYNDLNGNFSGDVGETITYTFKIKNTGNVPLAGVTINDPVVTVLGGPIPILAVGATDTTTFTATHIVTAADIGVGSFTNTATASGTPPVGPPVTDVSNDPNTPAGNDPTVTPIPPYAFPDIKGTPMNTAVTYNPMANDIVPTGSFIGTINGQPATPGSIIPVTNGTVKVNNDGTITVTPDNGFTGVISFPYVVTTIAGPYASTNTINVYKASDDQKTAVANTPLTYNPLQNDVVPAGSTISKINGVTPLVGTPITVTGGTVTLNANNTFTFTPNPGYTGTISFANEVTTPDGTKVSATETITVIEAIKDDKTTQLDTPITYNPLTNDTLPTGSTLTAINGTPILLIPVGTPIPVTGGTLTVNADGTITVTPTPGSTSPVTFTYEATTPDGTKVTATDTITVISANDDAKTTLAGQPITYNPLVNDTNLPPNTVISLINGVVPVVGTPITIPNATVTLNIDGTITVTPDLGFTGTLTFPYQITTPDGTKEVANEIIKVVKANNDIKTTPAGDPVTFDPTDNDSVPPGSTITTINGVTPVVGTPIPVTGGTVTLNLDGTITVTPTPGSTTPVTFPYEVSTPDGTKTVATVTINQIKANNDIKTTQSETPVTFNPLTNDTNLPTGTVISLINGVTPVVGTPIPVTGGTVTLNPDGTITVTPAPGSTTPVTFPYEVSAPDGTKTTAVVTITVIQANDDIKVTTGGNPVTYNPLENDDVPTGSTITKINGVAPVVGTPIPVTGGTVTLNPDGTITVTPTPGSTTPVTFPYEVSTPDGTKTVATGTLSQAVLVDDIKSTPAGSSVTYNPLDNDNVPPGTVITRINGILVVAGVPIPVEGGTVTLNSDGTITVTPNPGFSGQIKFGYSALTPNGILIEANDTINVEALTPIQVVLAPIEALIRTGGAGDNAILYSSIMFILAGISLATLAKKKLDK